MNMRHWDISAMYQKSVRVSVKVSVRISLLCWGWTTFNFDSISQTWKKCFANEEFDQDNALATIFQLQRMYLNTHLKLAPYHMLLYWNRIWLDKPNKECQIFVVRLIVTEEVVEKYEGSYCHLCWVTVASLL